MSDDDRAALRYAVASNETTRWFNRHTAYAGPHLLVIAEGTQTMSSPGRPSVIAVEELRRLDVLTDASALAVSLERGIEGLRETFRGLVAGDPHWDMHTLGQELVEAGRIRPDEMGSNPHYTSAITRWLDGKPGEPADITPHEAAIGDRYVLCTGGIERVMPPGTFRDILGDTARDPQDVADELAGTPLPAREYLRFTYIVADVVAQPR
jgi:PPM family protein phosphatase